MANAMPGFDLSCKEDESWLDYVLRSSLLVFDARVSRVVYKVSSTVVANDAFSDLNGEIMRFDTLFAPRQLFP